MPSNGTPGHGKENLPASRRYAALDLNSNEVVVYDTENETAWVQSDVSVELDNLQ